MMAERGIHVDHSTIHRWVLRFSPLLLERFNNRKRPVTCKWHVDETYVKVRGRWMYLYRTIVSLGDTIEFFFSEHRNLLTARCFIRKALARHGRPERIVIDDSQTNREAIIASDGERWLRDHPRRSSTPIRIRQSQYLKNQVEQGHQRIKRRNRSMLGFKSQTSAAIILSGVEMVHMMTSDRRGMPTIPVRRSLNNSTFSPHDRWTEPAVHHPVATFATEPDGSGGVTQRLL